MGGSDSRNRLNEGTALGIARNLARTHHRFRNESPPRSLDDVDARLRERGLGALVPAALAAYASEWARLERQSRRHIELSLPLSTIIVAGADGGLDSDGC